MKMQQIGKLLVVAGLVLLAIGLVLYITGKIPFLGKLPGDLVIRRRNFTFYFPLTTCLLISGILSLIFFILSKLHK
ncbi:MAG: DUF2905 domain-containing protein [Thermotogaceae bacterium]|nr:DUF2905 domain-containing protein [Thermotogaceae bacterium]